MAVNYNVPVEGIAGELTRRIDAARAGDSPIVVGIDGPGGAGKTTLAESLADTLKRCLIVPTDDFRRPPEGRIRRFLEVCDPGWDYDLERLRDQVLEPARRGLAVRWQRFDWQADRLGVWVDRPAAPVVLVEGVFTLHTVLRDYCGFKVWVGASRPLRLQRMVARG